MPTEPADAPHFVNPQVCSAAEPDDTLVWCDCGKLRAAQRLHGESLEDERLRLRGESSPEWVPDPLSQPPTTSVERRRGIAP